jgi:hypothetical protein
MSELLLADRRPMQKQLAHTRSGDEAGVLRLG